MGPIPPFFGEVGAELHVGGELVSALATRAGETPLFVTDLAIVRAKVVRLRKALPSGMAIHYAVKANPDAALLAAMAPLVDGFDIASGGELERVRDLGRPVSFAGPGKRDRELDAALRAGVTINLESVGEARRALSLAAAAGVRPALAVRVNPDFELKGSGLRMGGGARPFGVDAAEVPALVRTLVAAGADYRGLHIFAGSQALNAGLVGDALVAAIALAARIGEASGVLPPRLVLGGGFGIPYSAGETGLDVEAVGTRLAEAAGAPALAGTAFALELGRWLVGEAGVYLTRVIDRKVSHGQTFLVVDGGLHHMLAATGNLGMVVRRNYPVAIASRWDAEPDEVVTIVGPLCTPLDRLADQVRLPRAEPGDLVAVFLAGAYGLTASPQAFLTHPAPQDLLVDGDAHRAS